MKFLLLSFFASLLSAQEKQLEIIDFFDYEGIDIAAVRKALPYRGGETLTMNEEGLANLKKALQQAVVLSTGQQATGINLVCCTEKSGAMIYIDLRGKSSFAVPFNKAPAGTSRLPADLIKLDQGVNQAWADAVMRGVTAKNRSSGFSLVNDPTARREQLAFRALALKYERQILDVVATSSDDTQRAIAATALGYIRQTDEQLMSN